MESTIKKANSKLVFLSLICSIISLVWIILNPFISVSKGLKPLSSISLHDKNIPIKKEIMISQEEIDYAIELQNILCESNAGEIEDRISAIRQTFEKSGFSFDTYTADSEFAYNDHITTLDNAPTLLYGVLHSKQTNGINTSILISTELNYNYTVNPKANSGDSDCSYSLPSSIAQLLSISKNLHASQINHDIVFAIHINKYSQTRTENVNKLNMEYLLTQISMPIFNVHIVFPSAAVPLAYIIDGFKLESTGLNGRNVNLDLVSIVLNHMNIIEYQNKTSPFMSYVTNFFNSAILRVSPMHEIVLSHHIPSVTITANVRVASLTERTKHNHLTVLQTIMKSMKAVIAIAGAAEERIQSNDNSYIPIIQTNHNYQYISKYDIHLPCLLSIIAVILLLLGTDQLVLPSKVGLIYIGIIIVVEGGYCFLATMIGWSIQKDEVTIGLSVFIVYIILYSSWCYYRIVYNNAMILYGVCTEEEYKYSIFTTCGMITVLFSCLYAMKNPYLVIITMLCYYWFVYALLITNTQKARYALLMIYSFMLSLPFLLMFNAEFGNWCLELIATSKQDPFFLLYILVVIVGDHAILHYVNGMTLVKWDDEDENEVKEKMD